MALADCAAITFSSKKRSTGTSTLPISRTGRATLALIARRRLIRHVARLHIPLPERLRLQMRPRGRFQNSWRILRSKFLSYSRFEHSINIHCCRRQRRSAIAGVSPASTLSFAISKDYSREMMFPI